MDKKEKLNALKAEIETLNAKLAELSEDELALVFGGSIVQNSDGEKLNPEKDNTPSEADPSGPIEP